MQKLAWSECDIVEVGIRKLAPASLRRLVAFYVKEHNARLPHSAFRGQTPDEVYFGTGANVPDVLKARQRTARVARLEMNRTVTCGSCKWEVEG